MEISPRRRTNFSPALSDCVQTAPEDLIAKDKAKDSRRSDRVLERPPIKACNQLSPFWNQFVRAAMVGSSTRRGHDRLAVQPLLPNFFYEWPGKLGKKETKRILSKFPRFLNDIR
jgi:hypothetical protein